MNQQLSIEVTELSTSNQHTLSERNTSSQRALPPSLPASLALARSLSFNNLFSWTLMSSSPRLILGRGGGVRRGDQGLAGEGCVTGCRCPVFDYCTVLLANDHLNGPGYQRPPRFRERGREGGR